MDVHPPHQPLHTWKDFFIHLVAITIGLLLALGLEGLVEMVRHHNLVNEAKADLRSEISANHANAQANLTELRADEERIAADGKTLLSLRAGPNSNHWTIRLNGTRSVIRPGKRRAARERWPISILKVNAASPTSITFRTICSCPAWRAFCAIIRLLLPR